MALLEVRTEWAVYKDCFLQVAGYRQNGKKRLLHISGSKAGH